MVQLERPEEDVLLAGDSAKSVNLAAQKKATVQPERHCDVQRNKRHPPV